MSAAATMFVVDASMAAAWLLPDEKAPYPTSVFDALTTSSAVTPNLFHLELSNLLLWAKKKGRCTDADIDQWLRKVEGLPIEVDAETAARAWTDTLRLARRHGLTTYDASYLELAVRRTLPVAGLDAPLLAAAALEGVGRFDPGGLLTPPAAP